MASDFLQALNERVLVFDGAMGTSIQDRNLSPDDFGGKDGCNEYLVLTRPDVIREIHAGFLEVGCDAIETDTFGASPVVLGEYGLADMAFEINRRAAELAREVASGFSAPGRPRWVVGSIGPGTRLPSLGHIAFDELHSMFSVQAEGLIAGGADALLIETCQDLLQAKTAVIAALETMKKAGKRLPLMVQVTMESAGTMLLGTEIGAALTALEAYPVDVVGLNCATGPQEMMEHIRYLGRHSTRRISCLPNAGLPQMVGGKACYHLSPAELAAYHRIFVQEYGVSIVGGCCGTTPEHLKAVVEAVGGTAPVPRHPETSPAVSSLYSSVPLGQEPAPLIIGERTNANGSRRFKELLEQEDWDGIVSMAREQAREQAHLLDVCTAYVGRDEMRDMAEVISRFNTQVGIPLMIDSTEAPVIEAALKRIAGKATVNSINLEDGEERLRKVLPLCKRYGAAVVALTIDETGMAKTARHKFEVARRIYTLATEKYGIAPQDILFDALTFTLGSGDEEFRRAGLETIEAIRTIKAELPGAHTLLGVSNISFGLKPAARHVLNSVFLHYAIEYGLDAAIVHAARILPLYKIDPDAREMARQIVFDERAEGHDPLVAFMRHFDREAGRPRALEQKSLQPVEDRLKSRIIDGEKQGLEADLEEALARYAPLDIINTVLLDGMKVVGDLFASGEMQLPFVLQSAEVMKAAVAYLEPRMEKAGHRTKGRIVLATVKGDVHDIGKNLVDIILTNNGYEVINLGIKQPIGAIIEAAIRHRADAVGMSGLLVKSTLIMKENLEELNRRDLLFPVLLGGAALTRSYVEEDLRSLYRGDVHYGKDAFEGLAIMERLSQQKSAEQSEIHSARLPVVQPAADAVHSVSSLTPGTDEYAPSDIEPAAEIPVPPFRGTRILEDIPLESVFPYINEIALFRGQWQFKRGSRSPEEYQAFVEEHVRPVFERWKARCIEERILRPAVVYGYFPCQSEQNDLIVYGEDGSERVRFPFPRQASGRRRCIADFFASRASGRQDVAAFSVVTVGRRASEYAHELFGGHEYSDYLYLHGLSVETAEALAEYAHHLVREEMGFADEDSPDIRKIFQQGYRGSRYSFGYPACPNLEDQTRLFILLQPERIGVSLSEEYQLEPEQSTSAVIVHHPQAKYFTMD
ncbi:MAG: methionine synthase [Armatimonadetes bacterium]|nr:methionine synthase [Armatimonadota bacterium]